jgi:hypothetical protein
MAKLLRLGKKKKRISFILLSTFRNFAIEIAKLLRLGKKKKRISFILLSTFRNFAAKRLREQAAPQQSERARLHFGLHCPCKKIRRNLK